MVRAADESLEKLGRAVPSAAAGSEERAHSGGRVADHRRTVEQAFVCGLPPLSERHVRRLVRQATIPPLGQGT